MLSAKLTISAVILGSVCACGAPQVNNPDFFSFQSRSGVLTGNYNPAGYSAELVQTQIKSACNRGILNRYSEQALDSGLVAFAANCPEGSVFRIGAYEVERTADGNYLFEAFGS